MKEFIRKPTGFFQRTAEILLYLLAGIAGGWVAHTFNDVMLLTF